MSGPVRIRLSRAKGWRMPANTVKVDRTTKWGNPFNLRASEHCWTAVANGFEGNPAGRHAASVAMYAGWIKQGLAVRIENCGLFFDVGGEREPVAVSPEIEAPAPPPLESIAAELRGKNLACWCPLDGPCHADVLLELANH